MRQRKRKKKVVRENRPELGVIQWHLLTGPGLSGGMFPTATTLLTDPFRFDGVIVFPEFAVFTDESSEEDVVEEESSVEAEKLLVAEETGFLVAGDFVTCGFFFAISVFEALNLFPVEQRIARGSTVGLTGERSFVSADMFEGVEKWRIQRKCEGIIGKRI